MNNGGFLKKFLSTFYLLPSTSNKVPFRRFIEPTTALIQLTDQTQDLLLANFTEKGRYNIRLAQKR